METYKTERARELMERIGEDRPTYVARTSLSRKLIAEEDPEYLEHFHATHMHVMYERQNLPAKIKEIIISAVNCATGYERGVRIHIKGALVAGATYEEIFEGLQAASMPAGIHVLSIGLPVLKEVYEEWQSEKEKQEEEER